MDLVTRCEVELLRAANVRAEADAVGAGEWRSKARRFAVLYDELIALERNLARRVHEMRKRIVEPESRDNDREELELETELLVYLTRKLSDATASLQRELGHPRLISDEEEPLG
jgi:hypothetical protein